MPGCGTQVPPVPLHEIVNGATGTFGCCTKVLLAGVAQSTWNLNHCSAPVVKLEASLAGPSGHGDDERDDEEGETGDLT